MELIIFIIRQVGSLVCLRQTPANQVRRVKLCQVGSFSRCGDCLPTRGQKRARQVGREAMHPPAVPRTPFLGRKGSEGSLPKENECVWGWIRSQRVRGVRFPHLALLCKQSDEKWKKGEGGKMRFLLAISLVLMAFLLYGCAGNPQAPAQVPSAAPQAPPQKTTQPGSGNQQGTESAAQIELQDSKYSTDCMMAASKAYKSRNYQAGIDNCTIAINSIKVLKTKALPYRFRADLKEKSGDLDAA